MKGKRVGLYVRVSTTMEGQDTSYKAQLEQKKLIKAAGAKSIEVYADRVSGAKASRPEFDRMMEDARLHKLDIIYTKNLSRLARNVELLLGTVRELTELGVVVIFAEDGIRTDKSMSKLVITILGAVAELERENTAEHVKAGFEIKRLNGTPARPHAVPYGYRWNKETKKVEVVEDEAEVIRTIFKWFVTERRSCDSICKQLNRQGILKRGHRWERSSLQYIIRNPRYKGTVIEKSGEYSFDNAISSIVDHLTWDLANTLLDERKKETRDTRENLQPNRYPLSGKIFCEKCGLVCTRTSHPTPYSDWEGLVDQGDKKIQVWTCLSTTNREKYPQHEKAPSISEYYVYKSLVKIIAALLLTGNIRSNGDREVELSYSTRLKNYQQKKKQIEKRREKIYDAYEHGLYTEARLKKSLLDLEKEEKENVAPVPPDHVEYPILKKLDDKPYSKLDFSSHDDSDPVSAHRKRMWGMRYYEMTILDDFQHENKKREWCEAVIEKIVLSDEFTFYVYTKQGLVFEVKAPSRAPAHKRSTGELSPGKLIITKLA